MMRHVILSIHIRFDETALFQVGNEDELSEIEREFARRDKAALRAEFLERFHNVSRIMDCVGCEKCKLWGKLQVRRTAAAASAAAAERRGAARLRRYHLVQRRLWWCC